MKKVSLNTDGRMFNVDRWTYYSYQRVITTRDPALMVYFVAGYFFEMTPKQLRRCKKKANKRNDTSIGITT